MYLHTGFETLENSGITSFKSIDSDYILSVSIKENILKKSH